MIRRLTLVAAVSVATIANADVASDACLQRLKAEGGPDAQNGVEVLNVDASEAGTLVTMRDAGMSVWECLGYADGTTEYLKVTDAMDDAEGAMAPAAATGAGAESEGETTTIEVHFEKGTSGATYTGNLTPGSSARYVIGAKSGQDLRVHVMAQSPEISYQIFNPDSSFLLDMIGADRAYRGQLWQSGDHVVEVINRGDKADYGIEITIQ